MGIIAFSLRFLAVIILAFSASIADLTLGRRGLLPLPATTLTVALLLMLAAISFFSDLRSKKGGNIVALLKHSNQIFIPYLILIATSLACSLLPGSFWGDEGKWVYLLPYGFALFLFSAVAGLHPALQHRLRGMLQLPLLLLLGSVFYELWVPGFFSTEETRPAGFAGNSNFGALSLNLLCSAVLGYKGFESTKKDSFWLGITGIAILVTQSRSGLLSFFILLSFYLFTVMKNEKMSFQKTLKLLAGTSVTILFTGAVFFLLLEYSGLFQTHRTRYDRIIISGTVDDGSSDSRLAAARDSLERISVAPIIGNGTAHSRYMVTQPHNLYLQQWVNNGLIGLVAFVLLLAGAFWTFSRGYFQAGQAFILVAATGAMFSHNLLEQHPFLIVFGILTAENFLLSKVHIRDLPGHRP